MCVRACVRACVRVVALTEERSQDLWDFHGFALRKFANATHECMIGAVDALVMSRWWQRAALGLVSCVLALDDRRIAAENAASAEEARLMSMAAGDR
jgi:hypothetical protein